MIFERDIIKCYNNLLKAQQKSLDAISNLGREKDYEVQKIEKIYESKIDNAIREERAIALQLDTVKTYIESNDKNYKDELIKRSLGEK